MLVASSVDRIFRLFMYTLHCFRGTAVNIPRMLFDSQLVKIITSLYRIFFVKKVGSND